jgi:hypothetical protein
MLQLVQQVTNELGVPTPTTVAGNTNQDVIQILALMNASGYELLRKADWRELTIPYSFFTEYTTTTGDYTTTALTTTLAWDQARKIGNIAIKRGNLGGGAGGTSERLIGRIKRSGTTTLSLVSAALLPLLTATTTLLATLLNHSTYHGGFYRKIL